jgi:hypothetical protein
MPSASEIQTTWLGYLHSTDPADRPGAEAAVRQFFRAADFEEPRHFCWFGSPLSAAWALALLAEPYSPVWPMTLSTARKDRLGRQLVEQATALVCEVLNAPTVEAARALLGPPLGAGLNHAPGSVAKWLQPELAVARIDLYATEPLGLYSVSPHLSTLARAEEHLLGSSRGVLASDLVCSGAGQIISSSYFGEYPLASMATDQMHCGDSPPAILAAAWAIAHRSGPWWPFLHGAVLTERPSELHLNADLLPHRGDGPAVLYRDGSKAYAWKGMAIPASWIEQPESIAPGTLKQCDAEFRKLVALRVGTPATSVRRPETSAILAAVLPGDRQGRLDALRAHASGQLPLLQRYVAGDHQGVWADLMALGDAVRQDPHAADALAVACETMERVAANVRTVHGRLGELRYRFRVPKDAHEPPPNDAGKRLQRLQKNGRTLPLSLRAFYEVVGAVNFMGRKSRWPWTIAMLTPSQPEDSLVLADPLVVFPFEEAFDELDEDDRGFISIAPDDLHKADTSGGDPYEIAVPDLRADGELLNERHSLLFVDYLRLCFRFGGFPGFDGADARPATIDRLMANLVPF